MARSVGTDVNRLLATLLIDVSSTYSSVAGGMIVIGSVAVPLTVTAFAEAVPYLSLPAAPMPKPATSKVAVVSPPPMTTLA